MILMSSLDQKIEFLLVYDKRFLPQKLSRIDMGNGIHLREDAVFELEKIPNYRAINRVK